MLDRLLDIWWKLYDWIVGAVLVGMIVAISALKAVFSVLRCRFSELL